MPDGIYEGEDMLDCDGVDATEEYTIRTKVKIAGSRIEVDLSGSSRQARTCINCGWLDVKTSVATCLKFLLEPHEPFTSGAFRHVDIVLPRGRSPRRCRPTGRSCSTGRARRRCSSRSCARSHTRSGPRGRRRLRLGHGPQRQRPAATTEQPWASSAVCGGELGPWGATSDGDGENSLGDLPREQHRAAGRVDRA